MNARTWKVAGWIMALTGALTLAHAGQGQDKNRGGHPKGKYSGREEMLKRYDTDGDGQLSEAEREKLRSDRAARRGKHPSRKEIMQRFDADGDGQLNEQERAALRAGMKKRHGGERREKMLRKYDADGDGELNAEEMENMRDDLYERRKAHGK